MNQDLQDFIKQSKDKSLCKFIQDEETKNEYDCAENIF